MAVTGKPLDVVKGFIANNSFALVVFLTVFAGYCVYKMKKRNVKLFGR